MTAGFWSEWMEWWRQVLDRGAGGRNAIQHLPRTRTMKLRRSIERLALIRPLGPPFDPIWLLHLVAVLFYLALM